MEKEGDWSFETERKIQRDFESHLRCRRPWFQISSLCSWRLSKQEATEPTNRRTPSNHVLFWINKRNSEARGRKSESYNLLVWESLGDKVDLGHCLSYEIDLTLTIKDVSCVWSFWIWECPRLAAFNNVTIISYKTFFCHTINDLV